MKKITSVILALCFTILCMPLKAEATIFDDVSPRDWYYDAVMYLRTKDIVNGVEIGVFRPGKPMTRSNFAVTLSRCVSNFEKPPIETAFIDVACGSYYYDAVQWAYYHNIVNGIDAYHFSPERNITREQAIIMIYRFVKASGQDMETTPSGKQFADYTAVSPWAKEAMDWAINTGIINGDDNNRLFPQNNISRAQLCMVIYNARDILVDIELP